MKKYKLLKKAGEGTFSEVIRAQNIKTGELVAIKCMKQTFASIDAVNNLREIQALRRLSPHPNIVKLLEVLYDKPTGRLALVFELMSFNLYELIRGRRRYLDPSLVKIYFFQTLRSLAHMHSKGIFHRDIKPENILVSDTYDVFTGLKIADYGSCRGIFSKQPFTEYISTRWYRAPECLLTDGYYGAEMDIWGTACVVFEVSALFPLFPGTDERDQIRRIHAVVGTPSTSVLAKFKSHANSHIDFNFSVEKGSGLASLAPHLDSSLVDLLTKMLMYDPKARYTADQALAHPYFEELRSVPVPAEIEAEVAGGVKSSSTTGAAHDSSDAALKSSPSDSGAESTPKHATAAPLSGRAEGPAKAEVKLAVKSSSTEAASTGVKSPTHATSEGKGDDAASTGAKGGGKTSVSAALAAARKMVQAGEAAGEAESRRNSNPRGKGPAAKLSAAPTSASTSTTAAMSVTAPPGVTAAASVKGRRTSGSKETGAPQHSSTIAAAIADARAVARKGSSKLAAAPGGSSGGGGVMDPNTFLAGVSVSRLPRIQEGAGLTAAARELEAAMAAAESKPAVRVTAHRGVDVVAHARAAVTLKEASEASASSTSGAVPAASGSSAAPQPRGMKLAPVPSGGGGDAPAPAPAAAAARARALQPLTKGPHESSADASGGGEGEPRERARAKVLQSLTLPVRGSGGAAAAPHASSDGDSGMIEDIMAMSEKERGTGGGRKGALVPVAASKHGGGNGPSAASHGNERARPRMLGPVAR